MQNRDLFSILESKLTRINHNIVRFFPNKSTQAISNTYAKTERKSTDLQEPTKMKQKLNSLIKKNGSKKRVPPKIRIMTATPFKKIRFRSNPDDLLSLLN